ncbi:TPA: OsmC family protein [Pseudomonas aeruginosa]|jgi:organic hydroperoxide reductase OsmC/OhrA|nr:OsmC family protein [Pseudomonas aeruginosa]
MHADPEQLLISAVATCHMMTFVAIAELKSFRVDCYEDQATGYLEKTSGMEPSVTRIELTPKIVSGGN